MPEHFKGFINRRCEFFPCHDLADWKSCLFCYCPLYKTDCGGEFEIMPNGVKDCTSCHIPHGADGWEYVQRRLKRQL